MKKNLKKAISAVIALALSASLIPASFAAKLVLTDVADTASYATAVNTLVALDIINGYEDNTFKPDDLITRAEVTKVVVAALNKTDMAEGMTGSTGFADMDETSAWANGYINAGVQEGFINGMENNTFAPKANVTYAQIVKMLVSSMGYEDYAQYMGGWPNGYLAIANAEKITDGVKKGANDNVTRAEVAQLVYNALNTPIVKDTGLGYQNGVLVPTISKMDGTDAKTPYKSILTENFDAYVVEGYVTETVKSSPDTLEQDEVDFQIKKTEKYDNEDFKEVTLSSVKVGDTDAADYAYTYAKAIILEDEDDNKVLVSFVPSNKNKTYEFDSDLIDETKLFETEDVEGTPTQVFKGTDYLYVLPSETATKSVKYDLDDKVKLYVNGFKVDTVDKARIEKYVVNNKTTVKLVNTYDGKEIDKDYDLIYVDYYATAQVDEVVGDKIYFKAEALNTNKATDLELDEDKNDKLVYSIVYNGEEIEIAQLKENDVLSIKYNAEKGLNNSNEYEIIVSREVVTGKLTSKNEEDEIITVAGNQYSFVDTYEDLKMPGEYKLYLDVFGKIYKQTSDVSAIKYAIVDKITTSSGEDKVTLITTEGTVKSYEFNKTELTTEVYNRVYKNHKDGAKEPAYERVVEYRVNSSGKITSITFLNAEKLNDYVYAADKDNEATAKPYDVDYNSIGNIDMNESTKIFDAIDYEYNRKTDGKREQAKDVTIASLSNFADETEYVAYAFAEDETTGTYQVVMVTLGESKLNESTRFAVVAGAKRETFDDEAQEKIITLPVLYKGEETELKISETADLYTAPTTSVKITAEGAKLNKGDVIVFTTEADDIINKIFKVMNATEYKELAKTLTAEYADGAKNTDAIKDPIIVNNKDENTPGYSSDFSTKFTVDATSDENNKIKFVFGPIIDKKDTSFTIGTVGSTKKTNIKEDIIKIKFGNNINVYTYDYGEPEDYRLSDSTAAGIMASKIPPVFKEDNTIIDWSKKDKDDVAANHANFALALVVGGEAVDTLVFLNR